MTEFVIVCTGRAVDRDFIPHGEPCGRVFTRRIYHDGGLVFAPGNEYAVWTPPIRTPETDARYRTAARSAGWAIGPNDDAICPQCRKPDRELVKICNEIQRSLW